MPLDASQTLEIRNLIDAANEKIAKNQNDRFMLLTALGGVIVALLLGVFAWGLSSVLEDVKATANESARNEARSYLASAYVLQDFRTRLGEAETSVLQAESAAQAAKSAADQSALTINDINQQLREKDKILSALRDVDNFSASISANPEFQKIVASRIGAALDTATKQATSASNTVKEFQNILQDLRKKYYSSSISLVSPDTTCQNGSHSIAVDIFSDRKSTAYLQDHKIEAGATPYNPVDKTSWTDATFGICFD